MKSYKYTVEGTLLDKDLDFIVEVSRLASSLDIFTKISETKAGYIIVAQGIDEQISVFEPQLFRKLATFFNVTKYTKKESNRKKKQSKNKNIQIRDDYTQKDIKLVAKLLRQSKVVALKQDNGFHIICNASQVKAISELREITNQPDKPLPIVFRSIQKIKQQILLSKKESELLVTPEYPRILAKLKMLHRLEKPKYSLSPEINTINHRITVSIRSGNFYKDLFNIIDFPIVCIDAIDNQQTIITHKDNLIETYGDNFGSILDIDKEITNSYIRDTIQFVYGKKQLLQTNEQFLNDIDIQEHTLEVCLDLQQSNIIKNGDEIFKFKPYKLLLNEKGMEEPKYTAISILFSRLPIERVLSLSLPFTVDEINKLYNNWKSDINTKESNSVIDLFDAISSLTCELDKKSFVTQSILLAESHFEVCEEGKFDFTLDDNIIDIDIISTFLDDQTPKHLYCSITNTISFIIAKIAKEHNLSVNLYGKVFQHRDLIELTIERLEEEDLKVYFR